MDIETHCREVLDAHLKNLVETGAVKDAVITGQVTVNVGWADLYPKLAQRILAIVAYRVFKLPTESATTSWYHKLFPYEGTAFEGFVYWRLRVPFSKLDFVVTYTPHEALDSVTK